ncbi:MAG: FadR family transcriptional regulator [Acidobacteria bacterium]|nr:FadR family transcriptional regulator [Acidobacteriota bacterium]
MFNSITREASLTQKTLNHVEELILNGTLRPGDRLPPERELTAKLGVSKTVIREAMRSLAAKGLLDIRPGSGMYVRRVGSAMITEPVDLLLRSLLLRPNDVMEVREMLEVKVAGLAAERAKLSDIEAMEETIRALSARNASVKDLAEADVTFHRLLAAATGNPLISILTDSVNDLMLELRLNAFRLDRARAIELAIKVHSHILERVKARDAEGARRAMAEHLAISQEWGRRIADSLERQSRGEKIPPG